MAHLKRLRKDWAIFQDPGSAKLASDGLTEERAKWKISLGWLDDAADAEGEIDYSTWHAELQASKGPFAGALFLYKLIFPATYPFKHPEVSSEFVGFEVCFEEIEAGWSLYMVPPFAGAKQRRKCIVVEKQPYHLSIKWEVGEGETCSVSRDRWEELGPVLGRSTDMNIYHPLFSRNGGFCACGFRDSWAPCKTPAICLAYIRASVEDDAADGERPVPPGSKTMMCFCEVNPEAGRDFQKSPSAWWQHARERLFQKRGLLPLCISNIGQQQGTISVQCRSLAGRVIGEIQMDSDASMEQLECEVQKRIPLSLGAVGWRLVLPSGGLTADLRGQLLGNCLPQ
ncbi:unnamed protein product [Effrenium voratum]|nr:unnamed protein product [Effrenium voratum]